MADITCLSVGEEGIKGMPPTQTAGQYTGAMPAEPVEWVVMKKEKSHLINYEVALYQPLH